MGLLDTFAVPDDVAGYLEWASGILFVNRTLAEWRSFIQQPQTAIRDRSSEILAHTITHETYHFYQIATTGYLYRFSCRLHEELLKQIGFPVDERIVDDLRNNVPLPPSSALCHLISEIDHLENGVSIRDIVESAAYLYEYKAHYPNFGPSSYLEQLSVEEEWEGLPQEYSRAYRIAESHIGDAAFYNYLVIATLALCFEQPSRAFYTALDAVREIGIIYKGPDELRTLLATSAQIASLHPALGTAAQVAFERGPPTIPHSSIYLQAVSELNGNAQTLNPLALLIDPKILSTAGHAVVRPFFLKGGAVWIPEAFRRRQNDQDVEATIKALALFGAISLRTFNTMKMSRFRRLNP